MFTPKVSDIVTEVAYGVLMGVRRISQSVNIREIRGDNGHAKGD